jgi:hypothetical protein
MPARRAGILIPTQPSIPEGMAFSMDSGPAPG